MFLATVSVLGQPGKYEITESFVRDTAREAYSTARRIARLEIADAIEGGQKTSMVSFTVYRITGKEGDPLIGSYRVGFMVDDYIRRSAS